MCLSFLSHPPSGREIVEPDEDPVAREITGVVLEWDNMLIQSFKVATAHTHTHTHTHFLSCWCFHLPRPLSRRFELSSAHPLTVLCHNTRAALCSAHGCLVERT
jgi:hypothetical protein